MESPDTLIDSAASAWVAGPFFTLPSATENSLLWQGQVMTPSVIPVTAQPACVHFDENALNVPAVGWVTTTPLSANILPPPSGMSEVFARAVPDESSSDPHAVSA